jgi:hypothetical protein
MNDELPCGTPFETQAMQDRWKRLVRAAIKDKGGRVNSIEPKELRRLIEAYLKEHPEEGAHLRELGCF